MGNAKAQRRKGRKGNSAIHARFPLDDYRAKTPDFFTPVIPAKAGIQMQLWTTIPINHYPTNH